MWMLLADVTCSNDCTDIREHDFVFEYMENEGHAIPFDVVISLFLVSILSNKVVLFPVRLTKQ